jgi:hypothetical protein
MLMFWERFYSLCMEAGVKPNSIREAIGITSGGAMTYWKQRGVIPEKRTLNAIAVHFNTTVDYLLGKTDERGAPVLPEKKNPPGSKEPGGDVNSRIAKLLAAQSMEGLERRAELLELFDGVPPQRLEVIIGLIRSLPREPAE